MAQRKTVVSADVAVQKHNGYYYGYVVTTTLGGVMTIYDNASAATGTVIDVIPSGTAAGARGILATPVPVTNGIYADWSTAGVVVLLHD
jgi:hypothetical protein